MANNKTSIHIGTMSIKAGEDLPANRLINAKGKLCKENETALGATTKSWKQGEIASICFSGIVPIECEGGIFTAGSMVFPVAGGFVSSTGSSAQGLLSLDPGTAGTFARVKI